MGQELQKTNGDTGFQVMDVGIDEGLPDEKAITQVLREATGITTIAAREIKQLAELGIFVRGVGALRKQRGEVTVTQVWLNQSLQALVSRLTAEADRKSKARLGQIRGLAHAIALLSNAKTKSQELALELEKATAPSGKPDEVEIPKNTPFPIGAVGPIIAAENVHIHEQKKELPKPQDGNTGKP